MKFFNKQTTLPLQDLKTHIAQYADFVIQGTQWSKNTISGLKDEIGHRKIKYGDFTMPKVTDPKDFAYLSGPINYPGIELFIINIEVTAQEKKELKEKWAQKNIQHSNEFLSKTLDQMKSDYPEMYANWSDHMDKLVHTEIPNPRSDFDIYLIGVKTKQNNYKIV